MDTNAYLLESQARLDAAQKDVEVKEADLDSLTTEIAKLARQIGALKTLIEELAGTAAATTATPENAPEPVSLGSQEISETGTGAMILSSRRVTRGAGMPDRKPEFQQGTLREAVTSLITVEPIHGDVLANLIWQLTSQSELSIVKRSLNSELSRMHRDGVIEQTGPNTFHLVDGEGGDAPQ